MRSRQYKGSESSTVSPATETPKGHPNPSSGFRLESPPRRSRRRLPGVGLTLALAAGTCLAPSLAYAQASGPDLQVLLPNVLLLVDTSGSMELMLDGTSPEDAVNNTNLPAGTPAARCNPGRQSNPNRWGRVIQTLTGNIQPYYSCAEVSRQNNSNFVQEYQITTGGTTYPPYDNGYPIAYHRPISTGLINGVPSTATSDMCYLAPGRLPGISSGSGGVGPSSSPRSSGGPAWAFPTDAIVHRRLSNAVTDAIDTSLRCFNQDATGFIDSTRDVIRYGLMTFDNDTSEGTGITAASISSSSPVCTSTTNPFLGQWSYFSGWNTSTTSAATGRPDGCTTAAQFWEVGARSPAAPPWEGRLIPFDDIGATAPSDALTDVQANNDRIQTALLSMRPYGATPVAGLLADAQNYLFTDPIGPQIKDPYVAQGCRNEAVILLTDGAPNLDMRPSCEGSNTTANCPYDKPEDIAGYLATGQSGSAKTGLTGGKAKVPVYVIGFAVSQYKDSSGTVHTCSEITDPTTTCAGNDPAYTACCQVQKIAIKGGTTQAYFADTASELQIQFQRIISQIQKGITSRTVPAYSPVINGTGVTDASSAVYLASFVPGLGKVWSGNIQRKRYVCETVPPATTPSVVTKPVSVSAGDDFAANLNLSGNASARTFFAVNATPLTSEAQSQATIGVIRSSGNADGANSRTFSMVGTNAATLLGGSGVNFSAVGASATDCPNISSTEFLSAAQCNERAIRYALAQPTMTMPNATFAAFIDRSTNAFGDIYRATPAVVAPAAALIEDESYKRFRCASPSCDASTCSGGTCLADRDGVLLRYRELTKPARNFVSTANTNKVRQPNIVYAATNDGLLHAFMGDVDFNVLNELWAMLIPGVMPGLKSAYGARQLLLDGSPIVKDVVWSRTTTDLKDPSAGRTNWHTSLVGGFGAGRGGYYSVDVTDPDPQGWTATGTTGPRFKWQLTNEQKDNNQRTLFGAMSGTPAITTVFYKPDSATPLKEVGVAILVGGSDFKTAGNERCSRALAPSRTTSTEGFFTAATTNALPEPTTSIGTYSARTHVRRWASGCAPANGADVGVSGRSVYVVRLEDGQILRAFGRNRPDTSNPLNYDIPRFVNSSLVTHVDFDSPIVGQPLVYPNEVGAVAQKFFVGDADGTLWRIDVSDPDPANWKGELFLDAYNQESIAAARASTLASQISSVSNYALGQPIVLPPAVSMSPKGNMVINVATGSPEDLMAQQVMTVLYSVEDQVVDFSSVRKPRAVVNWFYPMVNERVTGPMAVFDSTLFYSTYAAPTTAAACSVGEARIYDRHYRNPLWNGGVYSSGDIPKRGGVVRYAFDYSSAPSGATYIAKGSTVIPGMSINLTPSCADTSGASVTDPVTNQSHYMAQSAVDSKYSLNFQVGAKDTNNNSVVKNEEISLATPRTVPLVDAWATIIE